MRRSIIIAILSSLLAICNISAQEQPIASQQKANAQSNFYVADLGDLMGAMQLRHFKLWFAGRQKYWDLANYEVKEIRKSFDAAAKFYPTFQNVALGKLISGTSEPALAEIDKSIMAKDSKAFSPSFDGLTGECNSCRHATGVGFIAIRIPTSSPFSNQSFSPAPE